MPIETPGANGLRSELLNCSGSLLDKSLLRYFDDCWQGTYLMPRSWVDAEVIIIYKGKGTRRDPARHRSTVGKSFKLTFCERLHFHTRGGQSNTPHGYCSWSSTEQAALPAIYRNSRSHRSLVRSSSQLY